MQEGATLSVAGQPKNLATQTTGWFKRGEAVPGIGFDRGLAEAAFKLSTDSPLPDAPVRGEKEVFVFRFVDRQIPEAPSDDAELNAIKDQLRQRKQREVYGNWMAEARSKADIEIDQSLLN